MNLEIIMPLIYLICLMILIGPKFLETNSSLKQMLSNLSVWALIIICIALSYQGYDYFIK
ncbi:MAG: hypothetical protein ACKVGX_05305 [Alphaproteobacteria bacterium]|tara:strand:+ start:103 stop:282 length:180 start_codon:yes stop_codon:yes gene_type:complete